MKRARFLRYAAIQFVVLVGAAMFAYAGGTWWDPATPHYQLAHNFLSDLGATHSFAGRTNYISAVLFGIALATLGIALVVFAWAWRACWFKLGRARGAGVASAVVGPARGAAFTGIAFAPIDRALAIHNDLVIAAFGLLLGYVACLTVLLWCNRVGRLALNIAYLALVTGYVGLILLGPRLDTEHGFMIQVVGQKIVAAGSMVHIFYLSTLVDG